MSMVVDALPTAAPVRIALLGAGLFCRDTVAPAIRELGPSKFVVRAIYSRSEESARRCAADFGPDAQIDVYSVGQLAEVLARKDIDAVCVMLPIDVQPMVIESCLAAGKHVLSEKPVAPDIPTGISLLRTYEKHIQQVWGVAENWRFEPAFVQAAEAVRQLGPVVAADMVVHAPMNSTNKFFFTEWRQTPKYPGSYVLDGGVHFFAALRMVLNEEAVSVSGRTRSMSADLPPPDTASMLVQFRSGACATVVITFAARSQAFGLRVACRDGTVEVKRGTVEQQPGYWLDVTPAAGEPTHVFHPFAGVRGELVAFATALQRHGGDAAALYRVPAAGDDDALWRLSPVQALRDVALVDALLRSAAADGTVQDVVELPELP